MIIDEPVGRRELLAGAGAGVGAGLMSGLSPNRAAAAEPEAGKGEIGRAHV